MKKFTHYVLFSIIFLLLTNLSFSQTTILSTDFETSLPAGWSQTTLADDGGWLFGINTDVQSTSFPIPSHTKFTATNDDACNCDKSQDFLTTSAMDFTGYSNIFLSFDSYFFRAYYDSQEETYVKVSTDGGNSWTIVYTLPGAGAWNTVYVNLTAYAGQTNVKVALHYDDGGGWAYGSAVDNFNVYSPVPGADISVTSVLVGKIDPTPTFVGYSTYIVDAPLNVSCAISNAGTETITSFD
ncbi:MAG: immune inhibitor A, partial [Chitinophagales bacterium]|nr:immune inhibitor A [Chitinophagales bacterium]